VFKKLLGKKDPVTAEPPKRDLTDKPFCEKLMARFDAETQEAADDLKEQLGTIRPFAYETEPTKAVAGAIGSIAGDLASNAMTLNSVGMHYPGEEWKSEHFVTLAFGYYIAMCMWGQAQAEKPGLDLADCLAGVDGHFTMLHSDDERAVLVERAFKNYEDFRNTDHPKLNEWTENIFKMSQIYVISYGGEHGDDEQMKEVIFPGLLKTILNAIE